MATLDGAAAPDALATALLDAAAEHAAADLFVTVLPLDVAGPIAGPLTLSHPSCPPDYFPGAPPDRWYPLGAATLKEHVGGTPSVFLMLADDGRGGDGPRQAWLRCANLAGRWLHTLPPAIFPLATGGGAWFDWHWYLYAHLRGTPFVVEGDGHSRLVNLFRASLYLIRLLRFGDATGDATGWSGSLRPGRPGIETEFRFSEVIPLRPTKDELAAHASGGGPRPRLTSEPDGGQGQNEGGGDGQPPSTPPPPASPAVVWDGTSDTAVVLGSRVPAPTGNAGQAIRRLLEVFPRGRTKGTILARGEGRNALKVLMAKSLLWKGAIAFPGQGGTGGYRIRSAEEARVDSPTIC